MVDKTTGQFKSTDLKNRTLEFRWKAAHLLQGTETSKNLISLFYDTVKVVHLDSEPLKSHICQKCYSIFLPSRHGVRLTPKEKCSLKTCKSMKKVARRRATQADGLRSEKYKNSTNVLKIKCYECGFVNELVGASRQDLKARKRDAHTPSRRKSAINSTPNVSFSSPSTPNLTSTPLNKFNSSSSKVKKRRSSLQSKLGSLLSVATSSPSNSLHEFLSSL